MKRTLKRFDDLLDSGYFRKSHAGYRNDNNFFVHPLMVQYFGKEHDFVKTVEIFYGEAGYHIKGETWIFLESMMEPEWKDITFIKEDEFKL